MISRKLTEIVKSGVSKYPVIAILGPRQSGKTTLAKMAFPDYAYVSLENLNIRNLVIESPDDFLKQFENEKGVILDEFQCVPELLSYIKTIVDETGKTGFFVITGSQNYLMNEKISQSLAGRVAIHTLLPLSTAELKNANLLSEHVNELIFRGCYPRMYPPNVPLTQDEWYPDYIQTYVERDVRELANIGNVSAFQNFMKLCAGRIGQVLNIESLSNDAGVSSQTINNWLSILEQGYILFLVRPHFNNFGKRIIKKPKIYFYDTGLACGLLEIKSSKTLANHYLRGGLFESFVMSELLKIKYNKRQRPFLYFWRDKAGHEVDCLIEENNELLRIEIKSASSIGLSLFDGLKYLNRISGIDDDKNFLVYSGDKEYKYGKVHIIPWNSLEQIFANQ